MSIEKEGSRFSVDLSINEKAASKMNCLCATSQEPRGSTKRVLLLLRRKSQAVLGMFKWNSLIG